MKFVLTYITVQGPLIIDSGDGDDTISITQTNGYVLVNSGSGTHIISVNDTVGDLSITTGNGDNTITIEETLGEIDVNVKNGSVHTLSLSHTHGAANITTLAGNRTITAFNTNGSLIADLGDGDDTITLEKTGGDVTLTSGAGSHSLQLVETSGAVDIDVGSGNSHDFSLSQTGGNVNLDVGAGDRTITAYDTTGSLTANLLDGDNTITLEKTGGDVTLTSGIGSHNCTFLETIGVLLVNVDGDTSDSHLFNLHHTAGSATITTGNGDRIINAINISGSFTGQFGNGDDHAYMDNTEGSISINSGEGSHNYTFDLTMGSIDLNVGQGSSHKFTLSETVGHVTLAAGIFDIQDTVNGNVSIISAGGPSNDVDITNTADGSSYGGDISVIIGSGPCNITTVHTSGDIYIDTQDWGEDIIDLLETVGSIDVKTYEGSDDDVVHIDYLGGNGTVLGGLGKDLLLLDARGSLGEPANTMDGSHIDWNGGEGDDSIEMYFVSAGITTLNIVGDNMGVNQVTARCSDEDCKVLSRRTFLANIHDPGNSDSLLERINLDPTASITTLLLYLMGGDNAVHFDDTICVMEVFGGDGEDSFHNRTAAYGISTSDPITTTLTTRGYLSDGCSHPVTLNGGSGNDAYDVLRNKCILDLNGESGDDAFVVRSFIVALTDNGLEDTSRGNVTLKGGDDGNDSFRVAQMDDVVGNEEEQVPDYIVNSLVDIDGDSQTWSIDSDNSGTGSNNLTIVGTELNDRYVVKHGLIFGGGLCELDCHPD
eukprot:scaffold321642_cov83-Cyclotella_meneghiniana.AAC.1